MSFAVLCGRAPHHHFFVNTLLQYHGEGFLVCVEQNEVKATLDTWHPIEDEREKLERVNFGWFYNEAMLKDLKMLTQIG